MNFLFFIFLSLAVISCSSSKIVSQNKVESVSHCENCNVVIITASNLRADRLTMYGYKRNADPKLTAWMKNGVVFDSNYAVGKWPFQALLSLSTGLYPENHKVFLNAYHNQLNFSEMNLKQDLLSAKIPVLSEIMKENNYKTIFMGGKPHHSFYSPLAGFGRGVDQMIRKSLHNPEDLTDLFSAMDEVKKDKFFVNINTVRSHFPHFILPKNKKTVFQNPKYKGLLPNNEEEYYQNLLNCFQTKNGHCPIDFSKLSPEVLKSMKFSTDLYNLIYFSIREGNLEDAQKMEDFYDESVAFNDEMIDEVFKYLEKNKLLDNTIVVVTSEMGSTISPISDQYLSGNGSKMNVSFGYNSYQEAVTKTPLIIYLPERAKVQAPLQRISEITNSTDLFPTVLGLVGVKNSATVDGMDLSRLIAGETMHTRDYTYGLSFRPQRGVETFIRDKNYIVYRDQKGVFGIDVKKKVIKPKQFLMNDENYQKMFSLIDEHFGANPVENAEEIQRNFRETYK